MDFDDANYILASTESPNALATYRVPCQRGVRRELCQSDVAAIEVTGVGLVRTAVHRFKGFGSAIESPP